VSKASRKKPFCMSWRSLLVVLMAITSSSNLFSGPTVAQPGKSPLVTIRIVFQAGATLDPKGKEGLASLTAAMIADAGTRKKTYQQVIDALYPMAVDVEFDVDKHMTSFVAETHVDNLEASYAILREMLLEPGWREDDLKRLKDDATNSLIISLRGNNDEELGKEILYSDIYSGHPYQHHNMGTVAGIKSVTMADIRKFYEAHYTRANLTIGVAGGYPADFAGRIQKDLAKLPQGEAASRMLPSPKPITGRHLLLVEKQTRSVAISMGFPISVVRGHEDYVPLLVAQSWLGQHRTSGVRLYDRIREKRGLNYGDYAYIEYFPRGMFQFEPDPNLARQQQIFQVWIRPVEPATAHFTLRLAIFELERFYKDGLSEDDFQRTRNFLSKYVNLLTKTKRAELGYAIDSQYYGIQDYNSYLKAGLAKLTRQQVNEAIRKHLSPANMKIVIVGENCAKLRDAIVNDTVSPMKYNSPKPQDVLDEDAIIERLTLHIAPKNIRIIQAETVFE
jgi:zinc protease